MADLGNIQVLTSDPQRAAIDRANRGLVAGLDNLSGVVQRKVERDVLGELGGRLEEDVASTTAGQPEDPAAIDLAPLGATEDPTEARLASQIAGYRATIARGTSSQAAAAGLKMKISLQEMQREHPAFAAQLAASHSNFVSKDPSLEALRLGDVANSNSGATALAQRRLLEIEEVGYRSYEDGGYGIPRNVLPSDPKFTNLWMMGQEIQTRKEIGLRRAAERQNAGDYDLEHPGAADSLHEDMLGKASHLQASIEQFGVQLEAVLNEFQNDRNVQDSDVVFDWVEGGGKEAALQQIALSRTALGTYLDNVPLNQRTNDQFVMLAKIRDNQLLHMQALEDAIMSEDVDMLNKWKIQNDMRIQEIRNDDLDFDNMLVWVEGSSILLGEQPFKSLTGQDTIVADELGRQVRAVTTGSLARVYTDSGRAKVNPAQSPEEIEAALEANRERTETPFENNPTPSRMSDEEIASATEDKTAELLGIAAAGDDVGTATRIINASASNIARINKRPKQFFEVRENTTDFITHPNVFKQIERLRNEGGQAVLDNWVKQMSEQRAKGSSANSAQDQITNQLDQTGARFSLLDGTTIGKLVIADASRFEKTGRLALSIDEGAYAQTGQFSSKHMILQEAREAIRNWEEEVHAMAVLDYARGGSDKLDYNKAQNDNGYGALLSHLSDVVGDEELD